MAPLHYLYQVITESEKMTDIERGDYYILVGGHRMRKVGNHWSSGNFISWTVKDVIGFISFVERSRKYF